MKFKRLKILLPFLVLFFLFHFSFAQEPLTEKEKLEIQLKKIEKEISDLEKEISKIARQKKSLGNEIFLLQRKIKSLELEIQKTNLYIENLSSQILKTENSISKTENEINDIKREIKVILREVAKEEQKSFIELLLSKSSLSDFFDDLLYLKIMSQKKDESLAKMKELKNVLGKTKAVLEDEKEEMENLAKIKELQKQESERLKKAKDELLAITKGKESEYQKILKEKQKEAAKIRQRIFELVGIAQAPTFGQAYEIAKYVSSLTGVRPAFLLAILKQESDLGKNVGQCYLTNLQTGEGKKINSGEPISRVMKPNRDIPHFLNILEKLGRNWQTTPVSCPMQFGWGGAMGPAQFIPSTWVKYESRLESMLGKTPDPWNIKDAFLAAAILLADLGAGSQRYSDEARAALIYFSGGTLSQYGFYSKSVMRIAEKFQEDINILEGKILASF